MGLRCTPRRWAATGLRPDVDKLEFNLRVSGVKDPALWRDLVAHANRASRLRGLASTGLLAELVGHPAPPIDSPKGRRETIRIHGSIQSVEMPWLVSALGRHDNPMARFRELVLLGLAFDLHDRGASLFSLSPGTVANRSGGRQPSPAPPTLSSPRPILVPSRPEPSDADDLPTPESPHPQGASLNEALDVMKAFQFKVGG